MNYLPNKNTIKFLDSKNHNYFGHKQLLYQFNNVFLSEGIFFDKKGNVLSESLDEHIFWKPECICKFMKNESILNKQVLFRKKTITKQKINISMDFIDIEHCIDLTHPFNFYAFGHLFDSLQRIHAGKFLIRPKTKFLVSEYDRIIDFTKHLSIWSGREVKDEDLIMVNNSNLRIQNLIFSLSPTIPTEIDKDLYLWIIDSYLNYFKIQKTEKQFNLYLSRNHVMPGYRGVSNEQDVIDLLSSKQFIILTGKEPLKDIVNYFANARIVIGVHGSILANTIFCNPDTKIIEFCPDNRICYNFRNTFKMAQNYNHILVQSDEYNNIKIDTNLIKLEMEQL